MHEQPSKRAAKRGEVLQRLNEELRTDERLAGLVLVGSGANGFSDDESDIDLVAPVTDPADVTAVFRHWNAHIDALIPVRYHADTAFTEQHHLLVLICTDLLEVDLLFPLLSSLTPLTPRWRILWDRRGDVTQGGHTKNTLHQLAE